MKKRITHLASMAVTALLALTACNEEAAVMTAPAEPQNPPVADNSGNVYITGDDFTWELGGDEGDASSIGAVTRSQLIVDGNTAKFTWTPGDRVGILPDQGAQVWFEIPAPEEGEEPTNVATFDGGAWALKPTSYYAAYYPFVKDFDLDRTAVPVSYTGQAQSGNGTTAHLGAYDYQGARPSTTNGAGGVSFDFDHVGALVLLQFTVPTGGTRLTGVTLSADGAEFTTAGTYDLTSTEGFPITPTETAESMTIGLDHTTTADGETVTLYFMCAPIDLSGKTVKVSVAYGGEEGETLGLMAEGKNLVAAGGYLMEAKEPPYLTFTASAGQTMTITENRYTLHESIEYSVNEGGWAQLTAGTAITFGGDDGTLRLRGKSSEGTATGFLSCAKISFGDNNVQVACSGDIRTLVDYDNHATVSTANAKFCSLFNGCTSLTTAPELPATTLAEYCYEQMFKGCTSLTAAPELPAITLAEHCYEQMFEDCTGLTTPPELSATTLADYCCFCMFNGCSSLITAPELPATTLADYCYRVMFKGCSSLITAPELPATTLAKYCYRGMFEGCTSLTTAPELPATTLARECYEEMFKDCSSLTTAPELPATTLAFYCYYCMFMNCTSLAAAPELPAKWLDTYCYANMFNGCTSLTTAPELPATTLGEACYYRMFYHCTSLTAAPELPATTLKKYCYGYMFNGCTSLTAAPELPATTLADYCYEKMFENCANLSSITMLATDISALDCLTDWVSGVAPSGTFTKAAAATLETGTSGIPEGWAVEDKQ